MKKVLILSVAIMMMAGSAMAADHLGIFTDQVGATGNCSVIPPAFSPFSVYVVHQTTGTTGSQFKIVNTSGYNMTASVLGGFLAIGDAFTDLALAYGGCMAGPSVGVVALNGFGFPVPGQVCGLMEVVPAPGKPYVIAVDCNFAEVAATAGRFTFNANETCPCVNATEESTWGKVKSLYR